MLRFFVLCLEDLLGRVVL